jgi:hypothetical protein
MANGLGKARPPGLVLHLYVNQYFQFRQRCSVMAHDDRNIVQTFTGYIQAFQTLEPRSVVPYCHIPCIFISPQGVVVMTNPAEVETFIIKLIERLTARGYARSELTNLHVNRLSESVAAVSVSRVRGKTDARNSSGLVKRTHFARVMTPGKLSSP